MAELNPYDTGEVLEPKLWVATGNAASLDPAINPHAAEKRSHMGRVDFDNEEGTTLLTVQVKRMEGGGYALYVDDHATDRYLKIQVGDW